MRFGFFVSMLFLITSVLGPVFYTIWIYKGTGNANFFYFLVLANIISQIMIVMELLIAKLKQQNFAKHKNQ